MTANLTPAIVDGPIPAGPKGDTGIRIRGAHTGGMACVLGDLVTRENSLWIAKRNTTVTPTFNEAGQSASPADWQMAIDGRGTELAGEIVAFVTAARDAALAAEDAAQTARDNALATERRIRTQDIGDYADDAAAVTGAGILGVTIVVGSAYWNTTSLLRRICSSVVMLMGVPTYTWVDEDADAQTQRTNAAISATAAANALSDLLSKIVGTFSTDPTYVGGSPPWGIGSLYFNTLIGKLKVWKSISGTPGWEAYDKDAQDAAATAIAQAAIATAQAAIATTKAGEAAASASAASSAGGYASSAATANSAAQAALLQSISYAALAQAGAATVSAQTGLSILAAAQRAVALMTDGVCNFIYDTRRDSDGGASMDKAITSLTQEALNTATRGATAKYPKMMLMVGRNVASGGAAFTVYDLTDPAVPMFAVWNGASSGAVLPAASSYNITSISALNGMIAIASSGSSLTIIDLLTETTRAYAPSNIYTYNSNLAARNSAQTYTTQVVTSIPSATIYTVAMAIAPNTQPNPLRYNLPNPTTLAFTASGISTLRWDGGVANSNVAGMICGAIISDGSGRDGFVVSYNNSASVLGIASLSSAQAASWSAVGLASIPLASLQIGVPKSIAQCGPGMIAIAGPSGLARIKLDPANPANSLINIKTAAYDTGWMVLGKTVLAMAESSGDLSTLTAAQPLNDDFSSYADTAAAQAVWLPNNGGSCALSGSGGSGALLVTGAAANTTGVSRAFTTIIGAAYRMQFDMTLGTAASVDVQCSNSQTGGAVIPNALGGTSYNLFSSSGTKTGQWFVATATTTWFQFMPRGNGLTATLDNVRIDRIAYDKSGSGNHLLAVGAPTRGVMATGADTAGYGVTAANFFRAPHVAAFDQGANDFAVMCPVTFPATGSYSTICAYSDEAGASYGNNAYWFLRVQWDGTIICILFDGTNIGAVVSTTTVPTSGVHNIGFARRGQYGELYMDGVRIARASLGSVGSVSNASANLLVGVTYENGAMVYPAVGKLGKLRLFNCAPTPDQFAFMMSDEAPTNLAYAQSLITGANVQGVAWDPDTEQLAAPNSTGGCDVFKGSVRVANNNSVGLTTNAIRETNFTDCVVGAITTGATNPFGTIRRADGVPAGVTVACVGRGFINGCGYVDVQISGTPGATGNLLLFAQSYQTGANFGVLSVGAASGQQWAAGLGVALTAGALTNIGNILLSLGGFSSAGGLQEVSYSGTVTPTGTISRPTVTRTLNGGATAQLGLYLTIPLTSGQAVNATLRMYQPNLQTGASDAFRDGFTQSANAKAAAFAGGKLAVVTAAGVDVWIPSADGLRAINDAVGSPKRPFYDPTWGQYFGVTTDATPTVFASIPIPEGKAFRFRATVAAIQWGGTATEKASYDVTGIVTRDLGGNVVVVTTTTTNSEVTSTMDCIAQANTSAQTLEIKATGKAATRLSWLAGIEFYDVGLMQAA